jgi:uroporphyrin-III C-methyltransferase
MKASAQLSLPLRPPLSGERGVVANAEKMLPLRAPVSQPQVSTRDAPTLQPRRGNNLYKTHDLSMKNNTHSGTCILVGAGPGDPELLTLKALKAIQAATVLFIDDLVNPDIVAFASPSARIVYVGKRGGCKSTPQAFIEKLMVMAVKEGDKVVRLKGGDPFIFGRGGEEIDALRAAGIEVSVINGITSGLAALTSLNVPLTHRDHAHGVVFVTGHAKPGDAGTNWALLASTAAEAKLTLVIYMGVTGSEQIQNALLLGLSASTPVAIIQNASLPTQRHAVATLGSLRTTIEHEGLQSPSVIVVGDVLQGLAAVSNNPASRQKQA